MIPVIVGLVPIRCEDAFQPPSYETGCSGRGESSVAVGQVGNKSAILLISSAPAGTRREHSQRQEKMSCEKRWPLRLLRLLSAPRCSRTRKCWLATQRCRVLHQSWYEGLD